MISETQRSLIGPYVIREFTDELGALRITVSRTAKGLKHNCDSGIEAEPLGEVPSDALRHHSIKRSITKIERSLFERYGEGFPYLPISEGDSKAMIEWLKRFRLPCRLCSHVEFYPLGICDEDKRLMIPWRGDWETGRLFASLINALPILLLVKD